jgi:hypothetical protein
MERMRGILGTHMRLQSLPFPRSPPSTVVSSNESPRIASNQSLYLMPLLSTQLDNGGNDLGGGMLAIVDAGDVHDC